MENLTTHLTSQKRHIARFVAILAAFVVAVALVIAALYYVNSTAEKRKLEHQVEYGVIDLPNLPFYGDYYPEKTELQINSDRIIASPGLDVKNLAATVDKSRPLILLFHGYGGEETEMPQRLEQLIAQTQMQYLSFCAPIPLTELGQRGDSFAWWRPAVPTNVGVAFRKAAEAVELWLDQNMPDGVKMIPLGFSQGGGLSSELVRLFPERFVAGVNLSGWVNKGTEPIEIDPNRAPTPLFFGYGERDGVIPADYMDFAARWLKDNTALDLHVYPNLEHDISSEEQSDIKAFLDRVAASTAE